MPVPSALKTLLVDAIDYAGLFPPAAHSMAEAVAAYAEYAAGSEEWALGRFVVPAGRLEEFADAAGRTWEADGGRTWLVSALASGDLEEDLGAVVAFGERIPRSRAWIDTIEWRSDSVEDLLQALLRLPPALQRYAELPLAEDLVPLVGLLVHRGAFAKFRTGGVTAAGVPDADDLLRALDVVVRAGQRFKCTAGLHHPVRGVYPLTYAADSPTATMHGYLNVYLATAALMQGEQREVAGRILHEEDPAAFIAEADGLRWRDVTFPQPMLRALRRRGMHTFGSCSFREPLEGLAMVVRA